MDTSSIFIGHLAQTAVLTATDLEGHAVGETDGFEQAVAPAVEWYKAHCHPHQAIIISSGMVELYTAERGVPFDTGD